MSERELQPFGAATAETPIAAPLFLTRLESMTLGMIAVTVSIVWSEQWTFSFIGTPGARAGRRGDLAPRGLDAGWPGLTIII